MDKKNKVLFQVSTTGKKTPNIPLFLGRTLEKLLLIDKLYNNDTLEIKKKQEKQTSK